ncbi:S8 family serine peptidase [Carboxylicivirga sp. RSCT41]|uniref:S8 family serine peptidase n=1 Tax=Carboxylicivirga agarovorans TaxID=3417570 RepID=UPI003D3306EE
MKRTFTFFKVIIVVIFLLGIVSNTYAQDWTQERSGLYYLGSEGKVFIEPDYNSMAVYFKNDQLSKESIEQIKHKLMLEAGVSDEIEVMDRKGMIRVKSVTSLKSTATPQDRVELLNSYKLSDEGAYELLPAFKIGDKQAWFTKRVCIRLKDGIFYDDISEILEIYDARYIKNITNDDTYLIKVEDVKNQLPLIQELHDMGVLKWGEPDFKVELVRSTNDPMYNDSWHLNNTGGSVDGKALVADIDVDAPEAWAITTGNSSVVVAVIDDGVEAHEDMPALLPGYTPVDGGDGTPSSSGDGHGQQVAGLISAQHNDIGAAGIAPGASTFSVNIFAPNTTNADVAEGIVWAVDNGADILSNSWGFGSCTYDVAAITDAFSYAATNGRGGRGCISLVASGNDFQTCVSYPANLPTVTAVGGISGDGERSMYSNYGPALDIAAPSDDDWVKQGRNWYSTGTHGLRTIDRMGSNGWYSGNYSEAMGGTSGATPQVSAVAALILSVNGNLTKSEVENILYTTATDMGDANQYGAGIVNAYGAVVAASGGGDEEAPTVPTNLTSDNITSNSVTLSWTASTDNVGVTGYDVFQDGNKIGSSPETNYNVTALVASTTYTFTVTAKDAAGNSSAASSSLDVTTLEGSANTPPLADAGGPYVGDEGAAITFDGTGSSDADGDPLSYSWDFGDGSTGTGVTPSHTYVSAGTYTAILTVSDGTDSDQATAAVTVNAVGGDLPMISSVSMSTRTRGPWNLVTATVSITSQDQAVSNAFVEGYWTGNASASASGYTNSEGTIDFDEKSRNGSTFTFTITNVTKTGYYWDVDNSQSNASVASPQVQGMQQLPEEFMVYPNPVTDGIINVVLPELVDDARMVLYDVSGSVKLIEKINDVFATVSLTGLKPGVYIMKIEGFSDIKPQRIIIK